MASSRTGASLASGTTTHRREQVLQQSTRHTVAVHSGAPANISLPRTAIASVTSSCLNDGVSSEGLRGGHRGSPANHPRIRATLSATYGSVGADGLCAHAPTAVTAAMTAAARWRDTTGR